MSSGIWTQLFGVGMGSSDFFGFVENMTIDSQGNLYVASIGRMYRISSAGQAIAVAGPDGLSG